jgi:hypothetical protein
MITIAMAAFLSMEHVARDREDPALPNRHSAAGKFRTVNGEFIIATCWK